MKDVAKKKTKYKTAKHKPEAKDICATTAEKHILPTHKMMFELFTKPIDKK